MRTRLALVALVLTALACVGAAADAGPAAPTSRATFVLTGGGWGHGVGMSQWGAYGQAKAGRTYDQILQSYYTGVELAQVPASVPKSLRVLVGDALQKVVVTSSKPFRVRDATSATYTVTGPLTITPDLELPVGAGGASQGLVGPLLLLPAKDATLGYGGRQYRANLRVAPVQKGLQVVNVVPLETYLLGVVPGEMPSGWPLEALKAQAVAARTYALTALVKGRSYDLYPDWRSQMYYGAGAEAPGPSQAVRDTRGQILVYDGAPIQALYFSSSGGRTQSALDVYGNDLPYLVSVDDPWDVTSPHHQWAPRSFTPAALGKALGLGTAVADARLVPGAVGRPEALQVTTATGAVTSMRITDVRARLGLRSTGFRLGLLRLAGPSGPRTTLAVTLTGVARDVEDPTLERRSASGSWLPGPRLAVAQDGSFSVTVRPPGPLTVRLVAGDVAAPPLVIPALGSTS